MKKRRRMKGLLALVCAVVLLCAGCGSGASEGTREATVAAKSSGGGAEGLTGAGMSDSGTGGGPETTGGRSGTETTAAAVREAGADGGAAGTGTEAGTIGPDAAKADMGSAATVAETMARTSALLGGAASEDMAAERGESSGRLDKAWIDPPVVTPGPIPAQPQSGTLTAGEWNDNENYEFFRKVLNHNDWYPYQETWELFPTERYAVQITTKDQQPVKNMAVELLEGQIAVASAVTDADGMAYLYCNLSKEGNEPEYIRAGSLEYRLQEGDKNGLIRLVTEEPEAEAEKVLDLMLVVDTTGSMADELEFLKLELQDVIHRATEKNDGMRVRLSVNFYRDEDDDYVIRDFPFTEDIPEALSDLRAQYSDGGGDYPEAVDIAFANGLRKHEWEENSVKLLFFVLDAPPHSERAGVVSSIGASVRLAAKMGVRVIPVASSGVDTETEYLLRTMAAVSGGTYTFLTDDSGVGNSHLEPTIGEYEVELLNDLMVRLINEYCR